ncbi:MAG: tetratricopeptide repeat protein [Pseudomonadota bacterium]
MRHSVSIFAFILVCAATGYGAYQFTRPINLEAQPQPMVEPEAGLNSEAMSIAEAMRAYAPSYEGSSASGSYLSGRYAQRNHDWVSAGRYIDYVLKEHPEKPALLKRAMVLAMGAGNYEQAHVFAREVIDNHESDNALALLFLSAQGFKNKDYAIARDAILAMPEGGLSSFIMPLLSSWSKAALGEYDTLALKTNTIHLYHAILIADFLGQQDAIKEMLKQSLSAGEMSPEDVERIADIYAHIGEAENAIALYEQALIIDPENAGLLSKIEAVNTNTQSDIFIRVKSAEEGVSEAFYDMARLLTQEYSDESARVFGHIALYLDPAHTRAKLLLASIAARNERFDDAIALYKKVPKGDENFLKARRAAADILYEQGRIAEAIEELQMLTNEYDDLDALIQIGNIHRLDEDFSKSIKAYNKAAKKLGGINADHWHLHYVRGMSYEQDGQWKKAEADLQAALNFQPNHPYVLNYLGYAWADQGENLEKALEMIKRAVQIRPGDGYITDSLGWVYYRMGRYEEAVPYLEQAVELMPYDPIINDHLGDAYWKVGRYLEAEFQWTRALNHSEDTELTATLEKKLIHGLDIPEDIKEAYSEGPYMDGTIGEPAQDANVQ